MQKEILESYKKRDKAKEQLEDRKRLKEIKVQLEEDEHNVKLGNRDYLFMPDHKI